MARAAVKHMTRGDAIVNCGSITGLEGNKELLDYSSTKGAIHAFTKSLAQNLVDKGIRVNCVSPGPVWTPLNVADKPAEEGRQTRRRHANGAAGAAGRDRSGVCVLRLAGRFELHHRRSADAPRWRDHCGLGVCRAHRSAAAAWLDRDPAVLYNRCSCRLCGPSCGSGGIGRRASLRSLCPQGRGGSSPLFRTISIDVIGTSQTTILPVFS